MRRHHHAAAPLTSLPARFQAEAGGAGEHRAAQPEGRVAGQRHRGIVVGDPEEQRHGTEELFPAGRVGGVDVGQLELEAVGGGVQPGFQCGAVELVEGGQQAAVAGMGALVGHDDGFSGYGVDQAARAG
jgi:hypothetical protein